MPSNGRAIVISLSCAARASIQGSRVDNTAGVPPLSAWRIMGRVEFVAGATEPSPYRYALAFELFAITTFVIQPATGAAACPVVVTKTSWQPGLPSIAFLASASVSDVP